MLDDGSSAAAPAIAVYGIMQFIANDSAPIRPRIPILIPIVMKPAHEADSSKALTYPKGYGIKDQW
jgi:hypothetical protein